MRKFTLGHLDESWSAPGGRQLIGHAANFTFESACSSPIAIVVLVLDHKVDNHLPSLRGWTAEST